MKDTFAFAFGSYNSKTEATEIKYKIALFNPSDVQIMTFSLSAKLFAWSDKGFHTYSGPITAIRIQHGNTVTGIQCRSGAHWSERFWATTPGKTSTKVEFNHNEHIKRVEVSILDTLDSIVFVTNTNVYGPFGKDKGGKNLTVISQCEQVHHFSGYLQWDESVQVNKAFSFAIHSDSCT